MLKKAVVKINTVNRKGKYICGLTNEKNVDVFYYKKQLEESTPDFRFIDAGDCVEITYTTEEKKPKEITKIEKWSVNDMRNKIIKIINESIALADKTKKEYLEVCNKYSLTEEGKKDERNKAVERISGEMAQKTEEGLKLFNKRIEEINNEEQNRLNRKNASLEYQQMIVEKATVLEMIGDIKELPSEYLKQYLQEFENDPVAILVMQSSLKGEGLEVAAALPKNNLGLRQEALKLAKAEFEEVMKNLSVVDDVNDISNHALAENFLNYMECQNDDFSLHAEEVWEKMNTNTNHRQSVKMGLNFKRIR